MDFYLALTIFALCGLIYSYNYGKNILSHDFNKPTTAVQTDLEDSVDIFFDYQTSEYCILNNVAILNPNSSPILVDTLVVSTSGVYVIQHTNAQGQIRYNKKKYFEKLYDGKYEKLFIPSQVDKTLLGKLKKYLPDIAPNNIFYVTLFNDDTEFTSIMPSHVLTTDKLIETLQQNSNSICKKDMIIPLGMLLTNKSDIEVQEYKHRDSA